MPEPGEPMRTETDMPTRTADEVAAEPATIPETEMASGILDATREAAARPIGVAALPTPGHDGSAPRVDVSSATPAQSTPQPAPTGVPVFEVRGFSAYYGDFRAIRDIDLDIPRNRITAFIGPSGCGKSTLLR